MVFLFKKICGGIIFYGLLIFLLAASVHARAQSNNEERWVTVKKEYNSLVDLFKSVKRQTGLTLFYSNTVLDDNEKVQLKAGRIKLNDLLSTLFREKNITWLYREQFIILQKKSTSSASPEQPSSQEKPRETGIPVEGIILNKDGNPIAGASIVIVGTQRNALSSGGSVTVRGAQRGTTSGADGKFILNVPKNSRLLISSIGYLSKEENVADNETALTITLTEEPRQLNELVFVGYSDKKRSELTSSVTVVSEEKLKDVTANNIGTMLQGKVAGLQVVNSSGAPGAMPEIRLRGISSINASQSPLFVVDGIIGGNYDPNDVESVTVLKDAAATSMYGSQANAGVIIVTTKKARAGKTRFEAKVTTGFRRPDFGKMKMMNGSQLYEYQKEFYRDYVPAATDNSYKIDLLKFYNERPRSLRDQDNNWLTEIFKPAFVQNYYFSFSGKTEKNDYYVGLAYFNEKGTFMNTNFQRINLRANSTYRFSRNVSLTNNVNLSASIGKSYDYMDVYYAYLNMPWDNPYDSAGNPLYVDGNSPFKWWSRDKINPVHTIKNSNHPYKNFDANYDLNLNIAITKWLSFSSTNRGTVGYSSSTSYFSPVVAGTYHGSGFLDELRGLYYSGISNNLLKFNFHKGDHSISGLAGIAIEGGKTESLGGSGKGLPLGLSVLNVVSSNILVNGSNDRSAILSYISQVNYSYQNKYFLTGSYRVDGSTAFPSSKRYGSFPAISAAWLVSNESFFGNKSIVDNLKLRGSYGVTGTQDIGASRYLGLYSLSTQYNSQVGATPLQLASPNLTWESKYQVNAGIDIGLFRRISLSVDVYRNITKNLLLQVSQPLSVGFEQRWENTGEIVNKGVEISLSTVNIKTRDFEWSTDFTINFNSNKLQKLPNPIIQTRGTWAISQIFQNGGNLYEFYMPKWLGVDPQTGAPLWEKITKNDQGTVTGKEATSDYASATYQESGSALPKYQGGITSLWKYRSFSLSANAYFIYGNKVFSNNLRFVMNDGSEPYMNQIVLPNGYKIWTQPGDQATNPSPQNSANSTETSTRYLMNGNFLSIRNITLAYELPQAVAHQLKMDGISVSLSADNVYTFSKFLGQDPQTTITPGDYVTPGVSDFKYPNNRQYLFNINFRF